MNLWCLASIFWEMDLNASCGLCIEDVKLVASSLEMGKGQGDSKYAILIVVLGFVSAGPMMKNGWFGANFAMAHQIYRHLPGEQTWMSSVDIVDEAKVVTHIFGVIPNTRYYRFLVQMTPLYTLSTPKKLIMSNLWIDIDFNTYVNLVFSAFNNK